MGAVLGKEVTTVRQAWGEFTAKRSPKVLAAGVVTALVVRLLIGDWTWRDAAAAGGMLVVYPFGEWAIHIYLLHLKPFKFRGRRVELMTAKAHREHHEAPHRLGLILLAPLEAAALMLLAVPFVLAVATGIIALFTSAPPIGALATGLLTGFVLICLYEWTHFLIHTAVRPKSRYYKAIWRNHRLHHFKNEHYWHGITNTVADFTFGTAPNHHKIRRSPTARHLHDAREATAAPAAVRIGRRVQVGD